jgi:glycosyltransferase involved in cell wall biosynthesis
MSVECAVVLNDFCHVQGGASRVAVDEAVALRAAGLDVTFLGAVGPICDELRDAGVRTVCLNQTELANASRQPLAVVQALWNGAAARAMRAVQSGLDPRRTIVHLHGYTKALTTAPVLAAHRAGFPTVCTLHDFFAACPNGAFYDYRREQPCQLHALSGACLRAACDKRHPTHKAFRVARGLAQKYLARFPAVVRDYIALSEQSAARLRPYLPDDARFHPLSDVIDVPPAPPADPGAHDAMVVVGRLDAEKGVSLALEAGHRAGARMLFVGDGPLRAQVEAANVPVTGWLPAVGVRQALERARCLVFPSVWYETFGLVVTEAAARGVPAIVSDISAPAERIVDGLTGWIFPSGDVEALAGCMRVAGDPGTARAAGAAAYDRYWAAPSDPAHHVTALTAIYEAVVARHARSRVAAEPQPTRAA